MKREPVENTTRGTMTVAMKRAALDRSNGFCAYPGCMIREGLEFDHAICLALGGKHSADNIQALCLDHHKAKTARDIKMIAKARRLAKTEAGDGRKTRNPIPKRTNHQWPKRPFPKRSKGPWRE